MRMMGRHLGSSFPDQALLLAYLVTGSVQFTGNARQKSVVGRRRLIKVVDVNLANTLPSAGALASAPAPGAAVDHA